MFSRRYVPFRFYAGSRVMLQKRIVQEKAWPGEISCARFRRFGFVEFSVPLREWIGSTLSLVARFVVAL